MLVAGGPGAVAEARSHFEPRLTATAVYISNVDFTPSDEDADYVTELKPGFSWTHQGRRTRASVDYDLQNLWYLESEALNRSYHDARADLHGGILDGMFTLDAVAEYQQQQKNLDGPVNRGNIGTDENLRDTSTFGIIPAWNNRFGDIAQSRLAYSLYDISEDIDSNNFSTQASVWGGRRFTRLQWRLDYSGTRVNYDERADAKYRDTSTTLRYRFAEQFFSSTVLGVENHDYLRAPGAENPRGFYWEAGFGWTPDPDTFIELRFGDRFFGNTYFLEARREIDRLKFAATYTEEATSNAAQQIDNVQGGADAPRNEIDSGDAESYIEKDAKVSVTFNGRRSDVKLEYLDEDRDFQATGRREQLQTIRVQIDRQLSRLVKLSASVAREDRKLDTVDSREWSGDISLERRLGRSLFLDTRLSQLERDATLASSEYRVSQVSFQLRLEL